MAAAGFRVWVPFALAALAAGCGDTEETPIGEPSLAPVAPIPSSSPVQQEALPSPPAEPHQCNAPRVEPFVGHKADSDTTAAVLEAVAPLVNVRWVRPGDATTEDFNPERLNVMLDVGDVIRSAHCG